MRTEIEMISLIKILLLRKKIFEQHILKALEQIQTLQRIFFRIMILYIL